MALEFKSQKDDAWYDARLLLETTTTTATATDLRLRINFDNFTDDQDEFVNLADVTTLQDLDALRSRVRRISLQLQDSECSAVDKGLLVCAARQFQPDDYRFFDAFIDGVVRKKHKVVKGEKGDQEVCTCSFIVEWIHGPQAGTLTVLELENICRVWLTAVDEEVDPALTAFIIVAKEKIENTCSNLVENTVVKGDDCDTESSGRLRKRHKGSSSKLSKASSSQLNKDTRRARGSLTPSSSPKGLTPRSSPKTPSSSPKEIMDNSSVRDGHDMDIGGLPNMISVENLEKRISSSTIMEFIYKQLVIPCQAFVSPSKSSEVFTRGTIMLNSKKNSYKLSEFLRSPDCIIISSSGRPWVLTEKLLVDDTIRPSIETFKLTSQALECRTRSTNELKVVMSGSPEYMKAKQLKDLFMEFTNHQCGLHQRLLQEEEKICG